MTMTPYDKETPAPRMAAGFALWDRIHDRVDDMIRARDTEAARLLDPNDATPRAGA